MAHTTRRTQPGEDPNKSLFEIRCVSKAAKCRLGKVLCPAEIQTVLCGDVCGLHSLDCYLLLPPGVVGPSGAISVIEHIQYYSLFRFVFRGLKKIQEALTFSDGLLIGQ